MTFLTYLTEGVLNLVKKKFKIMCCSFDVLFFYMTFFRANRKRALNGIPHGYSCKEKFSQTSNKNIPVFASHNCLYFSYLYSTVWWQRSSCYSNRSAIRMQTCSITYTRIHHIRTRTYKHTYSHRRNLYIATEIVGMDASTLIYTTRDLCDFIDGYTNIEHIIICVN